MDAGHASRLCFQSEQCNDVVLRAGTKFGKLAENPVGEKTLASYGVSGDTLLIRREKYLFCVRGGK